MSKIKAYTLLRWLSWFCVFLIFASAIYGIRLDLSLSEIKGDSWWALFKREYISNLIISPLWLLVAFLWSKADDYENGEWKTHKNQLLGLIKGNDTVDVIDIREIIQNEYNQEKELEKMRKEKEIVKSATVSDQEMKL